MTALETAQVMAEVAATVNYATPQEFYDSLGLDAEMMVTLAKSGGRTDSDAVHYLTGLHHGAVLQAMLNDKED